MRMMKIPKIEDIEITDIMYALSDPARVEIIRLISESKKALTCGELRLDRPKSSMSHHFKILRDSGIVSTEIEGKEHYNSLRIKELEEKFPGVLKAILKSIK